VKSVWLLLITSGPRKGEHWYCWGRPICFRTRKAARLWRKATYSGEPLRPVRFDVAKRKRGSK
jgi:hypothetical protein